MTEDNDIYLNKNHVKDDVFTIFWSKISFLIGLMFPFSVIGTEFVKNFLLYDISYIVIITIIVIYCAIITIFPIWVTIFGLYLFEFSWRRALSVLIAPVMFPIPYLTYIKIRAWMLDF